jgi:nucleoside-diphosphate-sugar epimerase
MIGQAIQVETANQRIMDCFVFTYDTNKSGIHPYVESIHLDLLDQQSVKQVESYSSAIYLAGNTDHSLASKNPPQDLKLNVEAFLNFMKYFKGALILFSSQAVYYSYEGSVSEQAEQNPPIPYGISRHTMELYAKYFKHIGRLSSLIIFRPTYIFGKGEKKRRLIPRCAQAALTHGTLKIFGKGDSFLNPLPVEFVARVVLKIKDSMSEHEYNMAINLNHPEPMTVRDVVHVLQEVKPFKFAVEEGGEEWPARHYGETTLLLNLLKDWGMEMPDVEIALERYFAELVRGK